jgi:hypothetical protein|nr:MAG TPA: apolipoprotein [Caudoviricetes sp.]
MDFLNVVRCCTPALPSAYADALSYYEALCKLQGAINEVIATLSTYSPVTEEWIKNYVTEQLTLINKEIDEFERSVNGEIDNLKNQYAQFTQEINDKIINLIDTVDKNNELFYNYIIMVVNQKLSEVVNRLGDETIINNPVYNKLDSLKNTLNMMYEGIRQSGITAYEYANLGLTATKYKTYNVSAFNYATAARFIWHKLIYGVYSAITGVFTSVQQAMNELTQQLRTNGLTANEYKALDLTATAYLAKDWTAYIYSWNSKT